MQKKLALLLSLAVMAGGVLACDNEDDNNGNNDQTCTQNVCEGNILNICSNGKFVTKFSCNFGCNNGVCVAEPGLNCSEGSMQCSLAGIPQKCISNAWVDQTACQAGQTCSNGACINGQQPSICTEGTKRCSSDSVAQICVANNWVDMTCPTNYICDDGTCKENGQPQPGCTEGAKKCSDAGVPQICSSNVWFDQEACAAGSSCTNGECVTIPSCNDGDKSCTSNGIPLLCVNGSMVEQAACTGNLVCNGGDCVDPGTIVCSEGAKQCSDTGIPQTCTNNAWVDGTACGDGATCVNGECKGSVVTECEEGETDVNGICVPNDMLAAADNTKCLEAWKGVEYCDNSGNAVYCATDEDDNVVLYHETCAKGCKIADMGSNYASFCDNDYTAKCKSTEDEFGFCVDEEYYSYESAYYCFEALDGGYIAVDVSVYGYYDFCDDYCNDAGTACEEEVTTCTKDSDCKTGEICYEGVCMKEGGCKTDADCSGDIPYCDDYFGECAPCIGGEADKGCVETGKVCSMDPQTWAFICTDPTPGCKADSDCKDGQMCVEGVCVDIYDCETDADCDAGESCVEGVCVETGCKTDADCDAGETCVEGKCIESQPECKVDADCTDGKVCVEGACVEDVECKVDADCSDGKSCVDGACLLVSYDVVRSIVLPGEFKTTKDAYAQSIATTIDGVSFSAIGNLSIDKGLVMTNRSGVDSHIEVTGATGIGTIKFTLMRRTNSETGIYNIIVNDDEKTKKTIDLKSLSADEAKTLTFTFNNANAKSFKVVPASYGKDNKYRMFVSKVEWTSIK